MEGRGMLGKRGMMRLRYAICGCALLAFAIVAGLLLPAHVLAAPTLQTFSFARATVSTSIVGPRPAGTAQGDLLIAIMVTDGNNENLSSPGGWTPITGNVGSQHTSRSWYKIAGVGEPANYTFTVGSTEHITLGILRVTGHDPAAPINVSGTNTGSTATPTCPSVNTTVGNTMILRYYGADDDDYTGDDTGYPPGHTGIYRRQSGGAWGECHQGAAYVAQVATGPSGTAAFTKDNNEQWSAVTIAIAPTPIAYSVSGVVFEDIAGDALPVGQVIGDPANPGLTGVTVRIYRDGGDGLPTGADDILTGTTATLAGGAYNFAGITPGSYWVTVDSRTITPLAGVGGGAVQSDLWAEQSYGSAGALSCDDDGLKGFLVLPAPGPCYGGRTSNVSDNAAALLTAEHVTGVAVVAANVSGVNSGFSFNVVTDTRDGDDVPAQGRSIQGSLGQFFLNANGVVGANTMRFVPAVSANSGGGTWWTVALASALPALADAGTTVDGAAYTYVDGITPRDSNSGTAGHGGQRVGTGADGIEGTGDEPTLPFYYRPELEINGNDFGDIVRLGGSNQVLEHVAIYNTQSGATVNVTGGTGSEIRESFLGCRADGTDPGAGLFADFGAHVTTGEGDVTDNYIAYISGTAAMLENTSVASGNDVYEIGSLSPVGDGITAEQSTGQAIAMRANRVENVAAYGLESWQAPGPFTFENNTVLNTGVLAGEGETGGIRVFGVGSVVRYNVVSGTAGPGIVVAYGNAGVGADNTITKNSVYNNGTLSIDIDQTNLSGNPNGDGVTANDGAWNPGAQNDGMDYPVFTLVTILGTTLHVEGYVGTSASPLAGTHTVEIFIADDDGNNNGEIEVGDGLSVPHGEGRYYVGSFSTAPVGTFSADLTVPGALTLGDGDLITGTATDINGNTSEFGACDTVALLAPNIALSKSVDTYYDPVSGLVNPKAIPGGELDYTISAVNSGPGPADNNTVVVTDSIPANMELYVGDLTGPLSGPIDFDDGTTLSGLSYTFLGLGDGGDDVTFYDASGEYTPFPDGDGYDSAVVSIMVNPKGQFAAASGGNNPSFTIRFRVRVK
jgi:uncharacterized repeat protein (TIGR01451 family)